MEKIVGHCATIKVLEFYNQPFAFCGHGYHAMQAVVSPMDAIYRDERESFIV